MNLRLRQSLLFTAVILAAGGLGFCFAEMAEPNHTMIHLTRIAQFWFLIPIAMLLGWFIPYGHHVS